MANKMTFEFLIVNDEVSPEYDGQTYEVNWQDTLTAKEIAHLVANLHFELQQEIKNGRITTYSLLVREVTESELAA